MQTHLEMYAKDETLSPLIRNAVSAGLIKLHEYYGHAKLSQYTVLATGMWHMPYIVYHSDHRRLIIRHSTPSFHAGRMASEEVGGRFHEGITGSVRACLP